MRAALIALLAVATACGRTRAHDAAPTPAPAPVPSASAPPSASTPPEPIKEPFGQVIGSYVTHYEFKGKAAPRAANIALAAKNLNGKVIAPGARFSFNEAVGVRSEEAGFVEAPVIYEGELKPGVGGGVCQVSSTTYAAALASQLKVVHRTPHTRPAAYIMAGLDATVAFPPGCVVDGGPCYSSDLVLENPWPWPVRMEATADGGELDVTFWGRDAPETKVRFKSTFSWTEPFQKRFRRHPWRKDPSYRRKVQDGTRGRRAYLTVTADKWATGEHREDHYVSDYPPVDEVWEVGGGWDKSGPAPWEPQDGGAR